MRVDHQSFNADVHRLIEQLELALGAAEEAKATKARALKEEQERAQLREKIERILKSADLAISWKDWELACEKLDDVLKLDATHAGARGKLEIVQRKIKELQKQTELDQQARLATEEKKYKEVEELKRKPEEDAKEKAHLEVFGKVRLETKEKKPNLRPYVIGAGILLLVAIGVAGIELIDSKYQDKIYTNSFQSLLCRYIDYITNLCCSREYNYARTCYC